MRTAEQWMKDKLDGTFTTFDVQGCVFTERVPKNFIPYVRGNGLYVVPPEPKPVPAHYWTAEEDALLLDLRDRKFTWVDIGAIMGRAHKSCGQRYMKLKQEVIDLALS